VEVCNKTTWPWAADSDKQTPLEVNNNNSNNNREDSSLMPLETARQWEVEWEVDSTSKTTT